MKQISCARNQTSKDRNMKSLFSHTVHSLLFYMHYTMSQDILEWQELHVLLSWLCTSNMLLYRAMCNWEVSALKALKTLSMYFFSTENDSNGLGHVLVVTKCAFTFPMKNDKPVMAANILVNKVSSIFGLPEGLLSERGRNQRLLSSYINPCT